MPIVLINYLYTQVTQFGLRGNSRIIINYTLSGHDINRFFCVEDKLEFGNNPAISNQVVWFGVTTYTNCNSLFIYQDEREDENQCFNLLLFVLELMHDEQIGP